MSSMSTVFSNSLKIRANSKESCVLKLFFFFKGHSGNIFGGVFSSWGPYMAPKEWGIAKTRPKKSIYEAREGQVCLLF